MATRFKFNQNILNEEDGIRLVEKSIIWFVALVVVSFSVWTLMAKLDEIAIAQGEIAPSERVQSIKTLQGGLVDQLFVEEGEFVEKGEILFTLNGETQSIDLAQIEEQISSLREQKKIITEELTARNKLVALGLDSKLQLIRVRKELSGIDGKVNELKQARSKSKLVVGNQKFHSPISGWVHNLKIEGDDSIVPGGETLLEILPSSEHFTAEIKISSDDIGHVRSGQSVLIKLNTYDFARYGGIVGNLTTISKTTYFDATTKPYYKGTIKLASKYLDEKLQHPLLPGMPLTAEIKTGNKTVFEYLLKPIFASAESALHER